MRHPGIHSLIAMYWTASAGFYTTKTVVMAMTEEILTRTVLPEGPGRSKKIGESGGSGEKTPIRYESRSPASGLIAEACDRRLIICELLFVPCAIVDED